MPALPENIKQMHREVSYEEFVKEKAASPKKSNLVPKMYGVELAPIDRENSAFKSR